MDQAFAGRPGVETGVRLVNDFFANFIDNVLFVLQRITWLSVIDLLLVTAIFFVVLKLIQDTQGIILIRGAIFFNRYRSHVVHFRGITSVLMDGSQYLAGFIDCHPGHLCA